MAYCTTQLRPFHLQNCLQKQSHLNVFQKRILSKIFASVAELAERFLGWIFLMSYSSVCLDINVRGIGVPAKPENYALRLNRAEGFSEVWEIVKDTVKDTLGEHRRSMLLFLDSLPLHLGAYHSLGTNNIVLNRTLVDIVEATTESKQLVNAFVYSMLIHEYLHALGHVSEAEVRSLIYRISKECFGEDHIVTKLAEQSPWALLRNVPLGDVQAPKRAIEIVKDFEKPNDEYII